MMSSFEAALPVEKWQEILANVSHEDLCNMMLTSRYMNSVASRPELWAGMRVNMEKVREKGLAQLYTINRFKKIKQMNFNFYIDFNVEMILNDIRESPLENISFHCIDFSGVSPDLPASALRRLKSVAFLGATLTIDQCTKVLEAILSSTTLVHVRLRGVNLSEVPPDLLACAIKHLKTVDLYLTHLTTAQCTKVLEAILSSTTLVDVKFTNVNLSEVPPDLLACAIKHLKTVDLSGTSLTTAQSIKILESILSSVTLVDVSLQFVDLRRVPPVLLANATNRLKTVNLSWTSLTTDQCVAVLKNIPSSTTLRHVNFFGNKITEKLPADLKYLLTSLPAHIEVL